MNQWIKTKEQKMQKFWETEKQKRQLVQLFFSEAEDFFFPAYCFRCLVWNEKGTKTRHREEQWPGIITAGCWWGPENRPVVQLLCRPEHVVISSRLWKHLDLVASKNTAAFNRGTCVHFNHRVNTPFFQNVFTTLSIMWPSTMDDSDCLRSCYWLIKGCVLPPKMDVFIS